MKSKRWGRLAELYERKLIGKTDYRALEKLAEEQNNG